MEDPVHLPPMLMLPVGVVRSSRGEPLDDGWGGLLSTIELSQERFTVDAVAGLCDFSHVEVIYFFHLVPPETIESGTRHPRGRTDWPRVGIFAQRGKARPNRMGVSRCRLIAVDGLRLTVEGLDAVDGTPVLDIKPYMAEFGPRGEVRQPTWSCEIMQHYYE